MVCFICKRTEEELKPHDSQEIADMDKVISTIEGKIYTGKIYTMRESEKARKEIAVLKEKRKEFEGINLKKIEFGHNKINEKYTKIMLEHLPGFSKQNNHSNVYICETCNLMLSKIIEDKISERMHDIIETVKDEIEIDDDDDYDDDDDEVDRFSFFCKCGFFWSAYSVSGEELCPVCGKMVKNL
jgi:rubrerythrin